MDEQNTNNKMVGINPTISIEWQRLIEWIKKKEIMPFAATWMQLEIIIQTEVRQKESDKYHMISLTCGI